MPALDAPLAEIAEPQGLRIRAARGTVISAAFVVGLNVLNLARGFVVAAFISRSEYGAWGVLGAILFAVMWLKDVGIADRYIQQDESDQQAAFETAFTLDLAASLVLAGLMVVLVPLYALAMGEHGLLWPGLATALMLPSLALRSPVWIFRRRLDYLRQRTLNAIDPIVGFAVTVALAVAGAGVWAFVIGTVAGSWAAAIAANVASPLKLRLRWTPGALRDYASFSWPLVAASVSGLILAQVTVISGQAAVGLAGVGAITLANNITNYAGQVDQLVGDTLYPAVCRVRDRADLLFESFIKSNRIAVMWGTPFGLGVALFAPDLVRYVIGERWHPALLLMQSLGVVTALNQICFNWTVYYRVIGRTTPFAKVSAISCAVFCATAVPLLFADGLRGLAIAGVVLAVVVMALRVHYVRLLFPQFRLLRHTARALAPAVPAVALVLLVRWIDTGGRTATAAVAELLLYVAVTAAATLALERRLVAELLGYVRGMSTAQPAAP